MGRLWKCRFGRGLLSTFSFAQPEKRASRPAAAPAGSTVPFRQVQRPDPRLRNCFAFESAVCEGLLHLAGYCVDRRGLARTGPKLTCKNQPRRHEDTKKR